MIIRQINEKGNKSHKLRMIIYTISFIICFIKN